MASTLCPKWLTIFVKRLKILYGSDHTILFKFHPAYSSNYLSNNVWRDFRLLMSASAVNMSFKLFPATVANADIGSLMSLHILFDKCLDRMPVKFEENCMVQTTRNFERLDEKTFFFFFF